MPMAKIIEPRKAFMPIMWCAGAGAQFGGQPRILGGEVVRQGFKSAALRI
jgi:hypothetical protein